MEITLSDSDIMTKDRIASIFENLPPSESSLKWDSCGFDANLPYLPFDVEEEHSDKMDNFSRPDLVLDVNTNEASSSNDNLEGSSHSGTKTIEQDEPQAFWVKWIGGVWQAGIRCARADWPLSTLKAKPTRDSKQYLVIYFPRTRTYAWADVLMFRPIDEYPHPIAYKTHEVGSKTVKDLTLARRFIMQKVAVSMLTTLNSLQRKALVKTARDVSILKEFAMEVSRSKDYSDLGRMLLKLQNMILESCIASAWLQHSGQSWRQRCQDAKSAECIEMLKEELADSILWDAVNSLSAQSEPGSEWRNWKHEVMKWFSVWHPMDHAKGLDQPINDTPSTPTIRKSRKRAKLEILRVDVAHAGPSLTKKGNQFCTQKLKSGRSTHPEFRKGLNLASYKIRNRSLQNLKKRTQASNSAGALEITAEPTVQDTGTLGRLTDSQCSTVAKLLFSDVKKIKPCPTDSEVLSIARSACCKVSLQAGLEGRCGVSPELMYIRAAKLCSEHNIIVEWHQEGFVCPRGCKPIEKGHGLSQMELLSDYTFKATSSALIMPLAWKMDESHCVLDSHHFSVDISENNITLCDDISFGLEPVPIPCVVDENLLNTDGNDGQLAEFAFLWESFTYVIKPVLDDAPVLHLESSQLRCDCGYSTCSHGTCDHVYRFNNDYEDAKDIYGKSMQRRFPYDDSGRIILEEGYLVYECNERCCCSRACRNRVLQNGVRVKLEVFKTENMGWAVRTREAILRGTFVCEYVGEIIYENEANKRRARYGEDGCKYFYETDSQINDKSRLIEEHAPYAIDATTRGNVSRYINHSCSPNLANHQVVVDSKLAHIGLYASRNIASGEELTYNFRYKMLPGEGCSCLCGSSNCRGRLY